jgi:transglutaminase-like putative cysteine protease
MSISDQLTNGDVPISTRLTNEDGSVPEPRALSGAHLIADPLLRPGDPLPGVAPTRRRGEAQGPRNSALAVVLLAAVVMAPTLSLAATSWVAGSQFVLWLGPVGLLLGLVFSRLRRPPLLLHTVGCLLGEGLALWAAASTLPQATLEGRLHVLAQRFAAWLTVVRAGGQATDNLLFVLALGILVWFVAYTSAYAVVRQGSPWWAVFANGAVLLVNAAYRGRTDLYLPIYLLASLLLVVRLTLAAHERAWRATGLSYPRGLAGSATGFGGLLATGVLALAFLAPAAPAAAGAIDRLRAIVQSQPPLEALEQVRAELERVFAGVPGQGRDSELGFGGTMTLQEEFRPGPRIVAEIRSARGRYWRAITYGDYTGRGWRATTGTTRQQIESNEPHESVYAARVDLEQRVRVRASRGDTLLAAAHPRQVGLSALVEYSAGLGGDPLATDLASSLRASRARVPGAEYSVISAVSVADEAALRAAGTSYPPWIVQRYGQAPATPERVRQLASRLAPSSLTPFERARAIEGYLRASMRYELKVAAPPAGRDGVDYFLFDSREGYCDYFATAMTVLLRSAGVPARVASGYAVGEQDAATGSWIVRDANAHSWVEVFFPRYGWIEFEPSPIRPVVERGRAAAAGQLPPSLATPTPLPQAPPLATGESQSAAPTPSPAAGTGAPSEPGPRPAAPLLPILIALGAAALLVGVGRLAWGWGIDGLPEGEAGYARMSRLARLLGRGRRPEQTPHEFAAALAARTPRSVAAIEALTDAFARARFARPVERLTAPTARLAEAWREVRGALLGSLLRRR